jgi:hypothetical protein
MMCNVVLQETSADGQLATGGDGLRAARTSAEASFRESSERVSLRESLKSDFSGNIRHMASDTEPQPFRSSQKKSKK